MSTITIREYGAAKREPLSLLDYQKLSISNEAWKRSLGLPSAPLRMEMFGDVVEISAQQVAGTIRVDSIIVEIAPKFLDPENPDDRDWRQVFWQVLMVSEMGKTIFGRAYGTDTNAVSVAELLAEIFITSYYRGSSRGMPLQYIENSEFSTSVRGTFDYSRFNEWLTKPWLVPTVESALSSATPLNRLLGWAASQLRTLTTSISQARVLEMVRNELPHPNRALPDIISHEKLQLDVQHEGLRPALDIAILLLRGHGVRHGEGEKDVIGFLWKSDDIYERFVFWLCREAGRSRGLSVHKRAAKFGISATAPALTTTPDVQFRHSDGSVVAVLDAKYKSLNSKPNANDSYQILTSAHHFGCRRVGLVYPSTTSSVSDVWQVRSALGGDDVFISALRLDLMEAGTARGRRSLVATIGNWLDGLSTKLVGDDVEFATS